MPEIGKETRWWLLLAAAALIPRIAGAVVRQPWHDEYFTVWLAGLPWREMLSALRLDSGPPLPYALTKLFTLVGVPALVAARAIAVAAGTAAVLLGARAARRAVGAAAGWWAGALLAFHPLALAWSCEGRSYALLLLAVAWAWERLEALAHEGRGAVGLALAVALGCWSHAFGLVLAATVGVGCLTLAAKPRRVALLAVAAGLASHLPWLPIAMAQPPAATAWMAEAWLAMPAVERVLAPVRLLPPVAPFASQVDLPGVWIGGQIAAGALCLALLAVSASTLRMWLLLLLPSVGLASLSALGVPAFYGGRGEALYLLAFLAIAASAATATRATRAAAAVLVAGGAVVSLMAIRDWTRRPPSGEARLAAAIRQALPTGGTVVVGGYWRLGLSYHLRPETSRFQLLNYPAEAASHPGWYETQVDRRAPAELDDLLARLVRRLLARLLRELGFLDLVLYLSELVATVLVAQLLLDRLHLLVEKILALGLLHLPLDAGADALLDLLYGDFHFLLSGRAPSPAAR